MRIIAEGTVVLRSGTVDAAVQAKVDLIITKMALAISSCIDAVIIASHTESSTAAIVAVSYRRTTAASRIVTFDVESNVAATAVSH